MKIRVITTIILLACVSVLLAGFVLFPDAPIQPCGDFDGTRFCGRYGAPHTRENYEHFVLWQRILYAVCPIGLIAAYYRHKRKP